MHLVRMKFGGVPPLTQPIELRFDEQVNVLIGPNAAGKSVLLKLLADNIDRRADDKKRLIPPGREYIGMQLVLENDPYEPESDDSPRYWPDNFLSASDDWPVYGPELNQEGTKPPVIYVGAVREELPAVSNQPDPDAFGDTAAAALDGIFSGPRTMAAAHLLIDEIWDTDPEDLPYHARSTLIEAVKWANACSQQICPEVIRDAQSHNYIPGWDVRGYLAGPYADPSRITVLRLMGLNTTDLRKFDHLPYDEEPSYPAYREAPEAVPIYLGHASSGTAGTLLWIRWLALKMFHHYGFAENWAQQPAILLIDEIENHLHPTWQRRVIPALQERFPKLQIFATTHSPFVVAGLKGGQVHRLYREKGVVKTDQLTKEEKERRITGWTVEEILREFMEVNDPTDEATAAAAATLRWLRERYPSDGEVTAVQWVQECLQQLRDNPQRTRDEEYAWHWLKAKQSGIAADDATTGLAWRDAALDELRDMVSLDLEAGGPLAAQQELFIAQLRDLLADDETDYQDQDEEV